MDNVTQYYEHTLRILNQTYSNTVKPVVLDGVNQGQNLFMENTQNIHFGWFCVIYSIIFLFVGRKILKKNRWQAKNREIKSIKELCKDKLYSFVFALPIIGTFVNNKFEKQLKIQQKQIIKQLQKGWDSKRSYILPDDGMTEDNIKKRIHQWNENQRKIWDTGKVSGAFYVKQKQHMDQMSKFAAPYMYQNPLHLGTFKQLHKMENQLLNMTSDLLTSKGKKYYGTTTSGGSQSLILTLYTHKKYYSHRKKPNVVVPVTIHAAIDKGCFYMNIEARKVRLTDNFQVDVQQLQSLIDSNTILIMGSAPNFPHGIIDPIDKIAKIAKKYDVGFHVDGCLGGFIGLFDERYKQLYSLDREGVTSVSLDHHKFALAPKGIAAIFYKTEELRHAQYYVYSEWPGGLYETGTLPGSRSGFGAAAGWYSLTQVTKRGYKQNSKIIIEATQKCANDLRKIPEITVFGQPKLCVIAFSTKDPKISVLTLCDYLSEECKWAVPPVHKPLGIHLSVTLANCDAIRTRLAKDVQAGIEHIKSSKHVAETISSAIYGATTKIPTNGMEKQVVKYLISASMK